MWSLRPVVRALAYRVTLRVGAALLQAVALVLLARDLGVTKFGEFVLGVTVGSVLSGVTGLGIPTRALRLHREPDPATYAQLMVNYSAVASVINGAMVLLILKIVGVPAGLALASAAVVVADQFCGAAQAVLAGSQNYRGSANIILLQRLVPIVGVGLALVANWAVLPGYALAAVGFAIGVGLWKVRRRRGGDVRVLLSGAWGFVLASTTGLMANLDVSVVRLSAGIQAAGLYGAASRLVSPLSIAVSTLLSVVVPHGAAMENRRERARLFQRALRAVAIVSVMMMAAAPIIGSAVVWALGDEYRRSFGTVVAVVIGVGLSAISQVLQAELLTEGRAATAGALIGCGALLGLAVLAVAGATIGLSALWIGPIAMQAAILGLLWWARWRLATRTGNR